jgi:hypothetical protein
MVKPPNRPCLQCGNVHWPTQPCPPDTRPKAKQRADNPLADKPLTGINKGVNKAVNKSVNTVNNDQPMARASAMKQAIERINELEAEVKALKRALADAHGKLAGRSGDGDLPKQKPVRSDMAAYMRERRAKAKAGAKAKRDGTVQFEG